MFERDNYSKKPTEIDVSEYINNSVWDDFCKYMIDTYKIKPTFEFSKCSWEYGWNIKFKKSGKTLATIYPRECYFYIMIVIGKNEKESLEDMLPKLSQDIQKIYLETKEGNGQKWLMIPLEDDDKRYSDVKEMIKLRSLVNKFKI